MENRDSEDVFLKNKEKNKTFLGQNPSQDSSPFLKMLKLKMSKFKLSLIDKQLSLKRINFIQWLEGISTWKIFIQEDLMSHVIAE